MKKIGKDRHKCVVYESTLSTAARSPFPKGEGYDMRMPLFSHCQSEYTHIKCAICESAAVPDRQSRPLESNAVKLSKILIAHASNSVCFFHPLSLLVNNKIKKLVK